MVLKNVLIWVKIILLRLDSLENQQKIKNPAGWSLPKKKSSKKAEPTIPGANNSEVSLRPYARKLRPYDCKLWPYDQTLSG